MVERRLRIVTTLLLLLIAVGVAPWVARHSPYTVIDPVAARNRPPGTLLLEVQSPEGRTFLADRVERAADGSWSIVRAGQTQHWPAAAVAPDAPSPRRFLLGTDRLGRDLQSRLLHGWRNSLSIALAATALALALGTAVGLMAAALGGWVDGATMRLVDVLIGLPKLFVLLAFAAVATPRPALLIVLLGMASWMPLARLVRAEALTLRHAEFNQAARASGCSPWRILSRHLLPHLAPTLGTLGLLQLSSLILLESSLSFVGAGLAPPTPTLGGLVADVALHGGAGWWLVVFPGLAIVAPSLLCLWAANSLTEGELPAT